MNIFSSGLRANKSLEGTIKKCAKYFNKAEKSINILGGDLDSDFYNDSRIIESLKNAVGKGAVVQIAVEKADLPKGNAAGICGIDNVKIWKLKESLQHHQMSIDSNIIRIEQEHEADADMHPAIFWEDVPLVARKIDRSLGQLEKTSVK